MTTIPTFEVDEITGELTTDGRIEAIVVAFVTLIHALNRNPNWASSEGAFGHMHRALSSMCEAEYGDELGREILDAAFDSMPSTIEQWNQIVTDVAIGYCAQRVSYNALGTLMAALNRTHHNFYRNLYS